MGREISCLDFPAETRREMLSRPVSSRNFEIVVSLVLSRIKVSETLKVLSCLDSHTSVLLCLESSFKTLSLSRLVLSRDFSVSTHQVDYVHRKIVIFQPQNLKTMISRPKILKFLPFVPYSVHRIQFLVSFPGNSRRDKTRLVSCPVLSRNLKNITKSCLVSNLDFRELQSLVLSRCASFFLVKS